MPTKANMKHPTLGWDAFMDRVPAFVGATCIATSGSGFGDRPGSAHATWCKHMIWF